MRFKKITFVLSTLLTIAAILFVVEAQNRSGGGANALLGTWKVRLTPSAQPQFDELMTFAAGGGIVESNNYPFYQLGLSAGPGQGTWSYEGEHTFAFTFYKFLYAPNGQAAGTLKASGTLTYSPEDDSWSGPAAVSICDNQGSNCNQIDTTGGQATRITAGS